MKVRIFQQKALSSVVSSQGVARFDSNQLTITSTDQSLPQAFSSTMQFTQNGATEVIGRLFSINIQHILIRPLLQPGGTLYLEEYLQEWNEISSVTQNYRLFC